MQAMPIWASAARAAGRCLTSTGGGPQQAEPAILEAARKAEQGGISYQASLLRASAVIAALARADLATAEIRWAELLPDEERRFAANEKGIEVVRLLLVSARLAIARNQPDEALKTLERAGALIASRKRGATLMRASWKCCEARPCWQSSVTSKPGSTRKRRSSWRGSARSIQNHRRGLARHWCSALALRRDPVARSPRQPPRRH
jgi:hypothetical protein